MDNSEQIIKAVGLTKTFKDFWMRPKAKAVNDIDFEVKKGEIIGLLGPNGSGKSTTVKMLLGLLYPTSGMLNVFGVSPRDVSIKKNIGYLPEETYLYKYLNPVETLDFFGSLFDIPSRERKRRIDQLISMVGLEHVKNRQIGEFSKGMSRRIGLAQAMINDPELLIFDEPTSGLDPLGCRDVKDLILNLKERGKTVVVTSHLLSDIEDVCDRVIILYGGKIRAEGALNDLLVIPEESKISTPLLSPEITKEVVELLSKQIGKDKVKIEHPHKSLENFFLDIVKDAKQEDVATAGAVSGEIANYLKAETSQEEILDSLIKKEEPIVEKIEEKPVIEENINQNLEQLLSNETSKPEKVIEEIKIVPEQNNLDATNEKLKSLLK